MSRKKSKRTNKPANSSALKPAMHHYLKEFQEHFDNRRYAQALAIANRLIDAFPKSPESWELKANALGNLDRMREASAAMATSCSLLPHQNTKASIKYAQYLLLAGFAEEALKVLLPLHKYEPRNVKVWTWTSRAYHVLGRIEHALDANDKACDISPNDPEALLWRSRIMDQAKRPTEARKAAVKLKKIAPARLGISNHIASLDLREGLYESAEQHFNDELKLQDNSSVATNLLVAKHYNPTYTVDDIYKSAREWQKKYVNSDLVNRASTKKYSNKRVRIGLLSGSFRIHPVGQMILPALQNLDNRELELFAYSTNQKTDNLTQKIKKCVNKWIDVAGLNDDELDNQIRQDAIDILIDLNGGGEGSRYQVISREPAPLIVKWVGMLINTTGLDCFDYLLSDGIETPLGVDMLYTEKLIRLPDDYVCYHIPDYIPDVNGLPALKNGYITFGCLNNPAKLSPLLIKEWADLLKEIPNSKLLLRGIQFEGEEFCKRMESRFFEHSVDRDRLILQGPARHQEFLTTYQSIDIALDTWPYSGGLTTCEALAMGVPVVTCMGPTFAGRHSATHLANAGLPELVTDNWYDFRKRAKELASDLPNLAVIRAALRTILKESPVCDGARFAKNFTKAMRGIWQRHCEGKAPEALTFNKEGDAWFTDEGQPIELAKVEAKPEFQEADFEWNLESPITVIDNGTLFARHPKFTEWMQTGNFAVITFDPGSLLTKQAGDLKQLGEWHHYPHATLGDGKDATLYATLDPELTGTLQPLEEQQTGEQDDPLRVLSMLPTSTVPLNAIEGLPGIDLLLLDSLNDAIAILENGHIYLANTLLVQVKLAFQPTHQRQPNLAEVQNWMVRHGFRFYRFNNEQYRSYLPLSMPAEKRQATELASADAIFLPNHERMAELSQEQCMRLAFFLYTVYGIKDMAYALLAQVDGEKAQGYLVVDGLANKMKQPELKREVIYDPSELECNQREFTLCVGVPVYNEEKYIRETIKSLKKQDFGDVKFLISDNCSTDNTLNIICEEVIGDDRFEIFQHQGNVGAAGNFEFAFKNSRSKYFMWLGGHDFLSDSYLSTVIESIVRDSGVSMVMGKPVAVAENSKEIGFLESGVYDFFDDKKESRYLKSVAELSNCTVVHAIFLREALENFEFRVTLSPDHVLISHLLWHGKLKNLSNVFYYRRFFGKRKESQDERIAGRPLKLERKDFFDYYLDDLSKLSKDSDPLIRKKLIVSVDDILRARFG
ncbi:glycosyltransferase [Halomonas sp. BL6]|uniref:O-linked N-acetylglucosamine transferase family protein n=1 Tax=Halomonas sp. BL6 TaxID=2585770 RepID=UPI001117C961|nr:glycosyltransferase [Halomonas sp. BL6]TNH18523.1 glycosyltransferase [Halomonas sp. BL6]